MVAGKSAVTVVVLFAALSLVACESDDSGALWEPKSGLPLTEPVQVRSENGVLKVNLDAARRRIDVSGSPLRARPFNQQLNGPTLHVRPGDTIEVTFKNGTDENTNIHYHGLHVSPLGDSDNVFRDMKPGRTERSVVRLPPTHPAGTYWYHVHFHGNTQPQVMGGLSGLLIVGGLESTLPPELRGIAQRQLALRELQVTGDEIVLDPAQIDPSKTTHRLVNGLLTPTFSLSRGESQLWRIANIGTNLFYDISLPGHRFTVYAEDGNPVFANKVRSYDSLDLPPGKRFDVVVQGREPGTYPLQTTEGSQTIPLAQVTVTGPGTEPTEPPTTSYPPRDDGVRQELSALSNVTTREFTFSFGPPCPISGQTGCALINGQEFDPNRLDVAVPLGAVEEWRLLNTTDGPHPFHIHVNEFQVLSINGTPYDATGLQDVVAIPPMVGDKPGEVVVRNHFQDFTGWFVFHCHILQHEDGGMMASVQVVGPGEPVGPPPMEMAGGRSPSHGG